MPLPRSAEAGTRERRPQAFATTHEAAAQDGMRSPAGAAKAPRPSASPKGIPAPEPIRAVRAPSQEGREPSCRRTLFNTVTGMALKRALVMSLASTRGGERGHKDEDRRSTFTQSRLKVSLTIGYHRRNGACYEDRSVGGVHSVHRRWGVGGGRPPMARSAEPCFGSSTLRPISASGFAAPSRPWPDPALDRRPSSPFPRDGGGFADASGTCSPIEGRARIVRRRRGVELGLWTVEGRCEVETK